MLLVEAGELVVLELGTTTGPIPLIDAELLRGVLAEIPLAGELDSTTAFIEDDVMDSIIEGAVIMPEDMPEAIELGITSEDILEASGLDIEPIDDAADAIGDTCTPVETEEVPLLGKESDTVLN